MNELIIFILGFIGVSVLIWAFTEAKYEEERRKREFELHQIHLEIEKERLKVIQRMNELERMNGEAEELVEQMKAFIKE
jgi:nitrogen fixation-related uncharacterized protein